jgi:nucleoid DNA-binding protein
MANKTVNTEELVKYIMEVGGYTNQKEAERDIGRIFSGIQKAVFDNDRVAIKGLGVFEKKHVKEREVIDKFSLMPKIEPAHYGITFLVSDDLHDVANHSLFPKSRYYVSKKKKKYKVKSTPTVKDTDTTSKTPKKKGPKLTDEEKIARRKQYAKEKYWRDKESGKLQKKYKGRSMKQLILGEKDTRAAKTESNLKGVQAKAKAAAAEAEKQTELNI